MKKILAIVILVMAVALILVSCESKNKPDETSAEDVTTITETDEETATDTTVEDTTVEEITTAEETTVEETTGEETTFKTVNDGPIEVGTYEEFDLDTWMRPFWNGRVVHNETVLFVGEEGVVNLLYIPDEIISVRSYDLSKEFVKGVDYDLVDGQLVRLKDGELTYMTTDKYYTSGDAAYLKTKKDGQTVDLYFSENIWRNQVVVTYSHSQYWSTRGGTEQTFLQPCQSEQFARTLEKLSKGEDVTIIFYGDSITYGASASSLSGFGPQTPTWPLMFTQYLAKQFGYTVEYVNTGLTGTSPVPNSKTEFGNNGTITYINPAVGGWTVNDGINKFDQYVKPFVTDYGCDLFLIGYGMNDAGNQAKTEKKLVGKIADFMYALSENTEIVLMATMVPNPTVTNGWYGNQEKFEPELIKLAKEYQDAGKHCAVCQMTSTSLCILRFKEFKDYTGNNVNHPSDFFARVYGQTLFETVVGYENLTK